jgi:hypothetical protein
MKCQEDKKGIKKGSMRRFETKREGLPRKAQKQGRPYPSFGAKRGEMWYTEHERR